MNIRKAILSDIDGITELLYQVHQIHAEGRPDLFKSGGIKYTKSQLAEIIADENRPIFVAADDENSILGYVFCMTETVPPESTHSQAVKTLYIDDLCVSSNCRGKHIGTSLYDFITDYARKNKFYRITLHVWECNQSAMEFYKKLGFSALYTAMEQIL